MWGSLEERLAGTAHTIVFDAARQPAARRPRRGRCSISEFARITGKLLDELGQAEVDVLGFSFGGLVAQELARREPGRVRRLALAGDGVRLGEQTRDVRVARADLDARSATTPARSTSVRTSLLSPADKGSSTRVPHLTEARLRYPPPLLGYAYQLAAGMCWSSLRWLHTVRTPTLVLAGGLDLLVPSANGVQLARLLPGRPPALLPEEGHLFRSRPGQHEPGAAAGLLRCRELGDSSAWSTGRVVDDDANVEDAFRADRGTAPTRPAQRRLSPLRPRVARHGRERERRIAELGSMSPAHSARSCACFSLHLRGILRTSFTSTQKGALPCRRQSPSTRSRPRSRRSS